MDIMRESGAPRESLDVMDAHAHQIMNLTGDLLELAKFEARAIKVELEDLEIRTFYVKGFSC